MPWPLYQYLIQALLLHEPFSPSSIATMASLPKKSFPKLYEALGKMTVAQLKGRANKGWFTFLCFVLGLVTQNKKMGYSRIMRRIENNGRA